MRAPAYAIILTLFLAACVQQTIVQPSGNGTTPVVYEGTPQTVVVSQQPDAGRAVFTIKDAPVRLSDVNEVWVTVSKVEVQSAQQGWITVSSGPHRYDLLQLHADADQGILADVALPPGTYQQVRLTISDVEVIDAQGSHDAVRSSDSISFSAPFTVDANRATVVQFDMDLADSLRLATGGQYVLLPVIRVTAFEGASVHVLTSDFVVVSGGTQHDVVVVGTDERGQVVAGTGLPIDLVVRVEPGTNTIVVVNGSDSGAQGSGGPSGSGGTGSAGNGSMNGSGSARMNATVNMTENSSMNASVNATGAILP